ncbi:MAG: hypothetical protein ACXVSE_06795, partial [Solirubrobacteraceae bacterium]
DIGARNEAAVRAALTKARIQVKAAETGGSSGRTVRIAVGELLVTVRAAGQPAETLLEGHLSRVAAGAGAAS